MEQCLQQLVNGLMIGSTYAVVALGFGLMFSVMRVVNLAHPEVFIALLTVLKQMDMRSAQGESRLRAAYL